MFDHLTQSLSTAVRHLRGQTRLTEANIQQGLKEIRLALLEADVALPVVQSFLEAVGQKAVGHEVLNSLSPGQMLVKIVKDELLDLLGTSNQSLAINVTPPAVVMLCGLQGAGKTTSLAKLARLLSVSQQKKVMTVSCDVYRPAAIEQLQTLSKEIGVEFFPTKTTQQPGDIIKQAVARAKIINTDVLLIDTAGRLHIDQAMMDEVCQLHALCHPTETLFVIDSMMGQDALDAAKTFNESLPLTGLILTKADGDARGGAALSARYITGKPIKFIGVGEKTDALEPFYPDRIASRILGMGDIVSLVETVQEKAEHTQTKQLTKKIKKGRFDLSDLHGQLEQMLKMGGLANLLDKLPLGQKPPSMDDHQLRQMVAIINAMTPKERHTPPLINGSRRKRIASGSGTSIQQVNQLMKQYKQMSKMMKKIGKGKKIGRQIPTPGNRFF